MAYTQNKIRIKVVPMTSKPKRKKIRSQKTQWWLKGRALGFLLEECGASANLISHLWKLCLGTKHSSEVSVSMICWVDMCLNNFITNHFLNLSFFSTIIKFIHYKSECLYGRSIWFNYSWNCSSAYYKWPYRRNNKWNMEVDTIHSIW